MAKTTELKESNIQLVRNCFYDGNIWTKNELAGATGLSLAGTTNVLQYLQETDEILFTGEAKSTGGRKSKNYILNKDYQHMGLITLMKDDKNYIMDGNILDLFGNTLYSIQIISTKGNLEDLDTLVTSLVNHDDVMKALVISLPGVCENGHVDICDYEEFAGFDLKDYLEDKYKVDIIIENDVNVACIGLSKDYPDVDDIAFIYQPAQDYVGCGMIIDHKLHNGFSHFAGELRYLPFYTHLDQSRMLREDPKTLLKQQILTLCVVVNPKVIGYCSDVFSEELDLSNTIDAKHLPVLHRVEQFNDTLHTGLYLIGLKILKEK